jgi:hypothetical protein
MKWGAYFTGIYPVEWGAYSTGAKQTKETKETDAIPSEG